ncbi:MAG: c-type cytochrome [Gemmatimonadetes bacterium]|nr:c-type cytochrome [Gemmatimonadota bacterium]
MRRLLAVTALLWLTITACDRGGPDVRGRDSALPPPDTLTPDSASSTAPPADSAPERGTARADTTRQRAERPRVKPPVSAEPAPSQPRQVDSFPAADEAQPRATETAQETARPADSGLAAGATAQPDSAAAPRGSTAPAAAPLRDAYHKAPLDTVDGKTYQGWKYYNLNCARCHGEDVQGTTIAPHLIVSLKPNGPIPDEQAFQTTVCGGRVEKGMPAWCSLGMTPAEIDTIYAYVKGRSDAKLHPGRPARRE